MSFSPLLALHISGGALGLLSGGVAVFLRKGSRRHGVAGNVFVVSMLTMAASAVYMASMKSQMGNLMGGTLTLYLVTTAWLTARRREGKPGILDWCALLVVLALGTALITLGLKVAHGQSVGKDGAPAPMYFIFGGLAVLCALGDVRMLLRGGISGTQRLVRHLWRMCFALFAASGSIFIARPHLFPVFFRRTGLLFILGFLPVLLMIFWMFRVRFTKRYKSKPVPRQGDVPLPRPGNRVLAAAEANLIPPPIRQEHLQAAGQ